VRVKVDPEIVQEEALASSEILSDEEWGAEGVGHETHPQSHLPPGLSRCNGDVTEM
jgi:hypothetical protein